MAKEDSTVYYKLDSLFILYNPKDTLAFRTYIQEHEIIEQLSEESIKKIHIKKFKEDMEEPYLWRLLLSIDQFFNVLLWNGAHDETISGHLGRKKAENRVRDVFTNAFESVPA